MQKHVIGLAGVARSGKDSLAKAIMEKMKLFSNAKRYAFADALKDNLRDIVADLGIDVYSPGDKKVILRPLLVAYGELARAVNPTLWVDKVKTSIQESEVSCVITDVRYVNEVNTVKNELSGIVVHISRLSKDGTTLMPANETEAINDPQVKNLADIAWEFPYADSVEDMEPEIDKFIMYLCSYVYKHYKSLVYALKCTMVQAGISLDFNYSTKLKELGLDDCDIIELSMLLEDLLDIDSILIDPSESIEDILEKLESM